MARSVKEVRATELEAVALATSMLQRARLADPLVGMWEAADVQWWWRTPQRSDEVEQLFWIDDDGVDDQSGLGRGGHLPKEVPTMSRDRCQPCRETRHHRHRHRTACDCWLLTPSETGAVRRDRATRATRRKWRSSSPSVMVSGESASAHRDSPVSRLRHAEDSVLLPGVPGAAPAARSSDGPGHIVC
jgi:hypothetical protein